MDSQIYMLLAQADQLKSVEYVQKAYKLLNPDKKSTDDEKSGNDIENFSQSLFVECAEKAISFNESDIANHCIQIYFSLPMIANQFLARAYLCQFELLAPRGTKKIENLEKSIPFLFKAIDFSKQNKRYNFLVYNASVLYWKYARNFIKKNYQHYLINSLNKIIESLREIDDADYEWRAFLERTLVEAYLDANQRKEAIRLSSELFKFIEKSLPIMYDEFFEFMVHWQLISDDDALVLSGSKWELEAIFRIEKLKMQDRPLLRNPVNVVSSQAASLSASTSQLAISTEDLILNALNDIYKIILPPSKFIQSTENALNSLFTKKSKSESSVKKDDLNVTLKRQRLLINLAQASLLFEEVNFCSQILGYLKEADLVNAEEFLLELEFIECELMVKELKYKQEKYTKNIVKQRNDCINKLHDMLRNAQRLNNPKLIQLGCMMQWNLCLPLLQPGLRKQTRKALQLCAECLENIDSMEWLLRSQIHFELAKCDEEIEQLQTAEQHLLKSFYFDDAGIYREQLNHSLNRLRLRAELYKTPERVEDQVAMILEQCVVGNKSGKENRIKPAVTEILSSTKSDSLGGEINTHSLLLRAADLLAPTEFTHVLESESFKSFGKVNEDKVSKLAKKAHNYEHSIGKCVDHLSNRLADLERKYVKKNPDGVNQKDLENLLANDYKERLKLWLDLCRISRKQQLWDICRVSARFCLLYDDEKLIKRFLVENPTATSPEKEKNINAPAGSDKSHSIMQSTVQTNYRSLFDRELMRNLAEANYILGESIVQYIRDEGIELFDKPPIPEITDHLQLHKGKTENQHHHSKQDTNRRNFNTDKEWLEYCEWLNKLCHSAMKHFLRGIQIGILLNESWIVCQGATYAWNYMHHIFEQKKHSQMNSILNELVIALQKVGHDNQPELLVAVSVALSIGLMQNWLPPEQNKSLQLPSVGDGSNQEKSKQDKKDKQADKSRDAGLKLFNASNEANNDFKKALEICEYAMQVTNGENLIDVISLKERFPLIKTWVLAKQMCMSPIRNINFSKMSRTEAEKVQDKFTKCMAGVEILNRNLKMSSSPSYEIKDGPSISELIELIDWADKWPDKLVELELWSNLAVLAGKFGQTDNLRQCHSKALESISYFEKKKAENKTIYITSQYLLSEACISLGEHLASLLITPPGSPEKKDKQMLASAKNQRENSEKSTSSISKDMLVALRRDALNAFADAAGYAARAESYENTIHSARHYWNLCMPYLQSNFERASLFENLREILLSLQAAYKFKPQEPIETVLSTDEKEPPAAEITETKTEKEDPKKANHKKTEAIKPDTKTTEAKPVKGGSAKHREGENGTVLGVAVTEIANDSPRSILATKDHNKAPSEDAFDDLTLRCVLYACLFQILIDKKDYEEALEQMEIALNDLPRTKHRLLIYRLKVITKSKLGLDVQMDLQKFKEESEKNLAQMYRKVALESIKHIDTINSYQRAIETLSSENSIFLKIEYILELGQWLYSHEYQLIDCIDLCEWAIDLLMFNIKQTVITARPLSASTVFSTAVNSTIKPTAVISRRTSKIQANPAGQFSAMLPTIVDEGSTLDHSQIFRNVDAAFKNVANESKILEPPNKDSLFDLMNSKVINWNEIQDIKQLECLMRSHVILAQMVQPSSLEYNDYLMKAYYSLFRLICLAMENSINLNKDLLATQTKMGAQENDKKKEKKGNSTEPTKSTATIKTKDNNKQATTSVPSVLPQTPEQWSLFELTEDISTAWLHENMKKNGINHHTIVEPNLTFYYLDVLGRMLNEIGYSQILFPIYNLQLIIINNVIKYDLEAPTHIQLVSLYSYVRLKLIDLCVELNLVNSVAFQQQSLATFILANSKLKNEPVEPNLLNQTVGANPSILLKLVQIDPIEVVFLKEQIYNQKQRMSQIIAEEETSLNANSTFSLGSTTRKLNNDLVSTKTKKKNRAKSTKFDESKDKSQGFNVVEDINLPGEHRKVHDNLQEILYKDAWILMAETLIKDGFFQTARDFLYESLNACLNFDDKQCIAKIQYLMAKIALFDCNFIEARNLAASAQRIAIDETHWFNSILVLVDAHYLDREDKESSEKCIQILNKSINLLKHEKIRRNNKKNKFEYFEAILNYKLAQIMCDGIINGKLKEGGDLSARQAKTGRRSTKRNTMHPSLFKKLSEVCNMYHSSISLLLANGFRRETLQIFKSHAKLLQKFSLDCHNQEAKCDYMLQIYGVLSEACNVANEIWIELESLQQINETQNLSLPVQREMIDLKLELAQLLTDMLELNLNETINENEKNIGRNAIHKVVENFITTNENMSKVELEWQLISAQLPDIIFGNLISCHSLSFRIKQFRAQTLYLIGRTFRLLAELKLQTKKCELNDKSTNYLTISASLSKWSPVIIELIREKYQQIVDQMEATKSKAKTTKSTINITSAQTEISEITENDANNNLDHLAPVFENSNLTNLLEQQQLKNLLTVVNQTEAQGMECLLQALNLSFINEDKALIRNICYELIEIIGRFDLVFTSQLISLYQSCSAGIEIEQIIEKSSIDPKNSLLVSYLHQSKYFQRMNVTYNIMNSPVVKQLLDGTKNKFNALKYLNVNSNYFNLTKELPANCLVIVLQHNNLRTELFGTVLNNSKDTQPITNIKSSQLQFLANSVASIKSSSIKVKTHPFELFHLQQQWKEWKSSLQSFNLKIEFQLNNDLIKKTHSDNTTAQEQLSDIMQIYLNSNNPKFEEMYRDMRELDSKFDYLMNKTEAYLQPITEFFQSVLSTAEFQPQTPKPSIKLILLADLDLFEFPLESLKIFHHNLSICSISRDFSLQFFVTRVILNREAESILANEKANAPKAAKAEKKQTQAVAVLEPLPEGAVVVDCNRFKYLVDVFLESSSNLPNDYSPINTLKKLINLYPQVCSRWSGITGADHIAGLGECERLLSESHGFLFNGTERILSYFNSSKISSFNLDCKLVISNDMAQTSKSFSRIGKQDVLRNTEEIECEQPLEACILLSLSGVKSIIANQWSSSLAENSDKLHYVFREFIESRQSCGELIRYRIAPHLKIMSTENAKKDEETLKVVGTDSKKNKNASAMRADTTTTKKSEKTISQMQTIQSATVTAQQSEELTKKNEEDEKRKKEDDEKRAELIKKAQILKKEKSNMVLYGLPSVYLVS